MLTERQQNILKLIVDYYIKTAQPISSKVLSEELECSSATIRNEMVVLEEKGLIEKTHTSSGRIPSEIGYRFYVDYLMKPKQMTGEDMLRLQTIFSNHQLAISDAVLESMKIITDLTDYTAVVLGPDAEHNLLKEVRVVPLSNDTIVAIVITDKGLVENKTIRFEQLIDVEEIGRVVDLINKMLEGTPITDIPSKLEFDIKPIIGDYIAHHEAVYSAFYNAFNQFTDIHNMKFSGKDNIFKQAEFRDIDKVQKLLNSFDTGEIKDVIDYEEEGIVVRIGHENEVEGMENCTIVTTNYHVGDDVGKIAILGPKRMEYNRVISLLEYLNKNLKR
jgi:heat-inducible transcriptional repressor